MVTHIDLDVWINDKTDITINKMTDTWTGLMFDSTRVTLFTSPDNIKRIIDVLLTALEKRQAEEDDPDTRGDENRPSEGSGAPVAADSPR
jgi:hypothetical protein